MRAEWQALHGRLDRLSRVRQFQEEFRERCAGCEALAPWSEPGSLLAMLHRPGDAVDKNGVLRALVAIAQGGDSPRGVAQVSLLLALWPGLDAVYRRHLHRFRSDASVLAADLLSQVALGIRTLRLDRVNRIAATLLRNAERDLGRAEMSRRRWQSRSDEINDTLITKNADRSQVPHPGADPEDPRSAAVMRALGQLPRQDVAMLLAVVVDGETQRQAAAQFGLGHAAARKRYQRALGRLRDAIEAS